MGSSGLQLAQSAKREGSTDPEMLTPNGKRPVRIPLRLKILLSSSALLVALIGAMLIYVSSQAERLVGQSIAKDLDQGRMRVGDAQNEQLAGLRQTARLVASLPQLKALLDKTDFATIKDFLVGYQQQNQGPNVLIVLDQRGKVVARTDALEPEPLPNAEAQWTQPSLGGQSANVLVTQDRVYNAAAAPAEAGGTVFGFVIAGASIDDAYARSLRDFSRDEIVIVGDRRLGSTLVATKLPWQTRAQWIAAVGTGDDAHEVSIDNETYEAVATPLGAGDSPLAICLQSRDRALAPYRRIQVGLLVLGLLTALLGISASAFLARSITAPVKKLVEGTREVASGNFDFHLEITSRDEIGDLAKSFNVMIQGLRERAHMQKFVSQSTVEMIQSRDHRKVSAGERKQLTIFFSDIRGFTAMSERRGPEEVVELLNDCLSLQASKVKKFSGDVDKYVGDAVVALFDGEDMALNAIRCGVEIHRAVAQQNVDHPDRQPIELGIGIVTGEVILGSIGSKDRLDFTVIGSNVNLCSRLCSLAGPREILIAESTYQMVRDLVAAERLDPLNVKGFSEAVPVYRMSVK